MKKTTSFMLGAILGMSVLAAYNKYGCEVMDSIKKSTKKMKKDMEKTIDDMV